MRPHAVRRHGRAARGSAGTLPEPGAGAGARGSALRPEALFGAFQFYDAQEDDARMVAFLARTATANGAALATNVRMDGLLTDGQRVSVEWARDLLHGTDLRIHPGASRRSAGHTAPGPTATAHGPRRRGRYEGLQVRPSKGVHIVVPRDTILMETGLLTRTENSVLFVASRGVITGSSATPTPNGSMTPATRRRAGRYDIDYLLAKANRMLQDPITPVDVEGVFAGLRGRWSRPRPGTPRGSAASTPSIPPRRAHDYRGRQVHDVPGDGPRPHRRAARPDPGPARPAVRPYRPGPPASARPDTPGYGTCASTSPSAAACPWPGSSGCSDVTARARKICSSSSGGGLSWDCRCA